MFTDTIRYSVGGFNIVSVANQKDLGIIVTNIPCLEIATVVKVLYNKNAYHALHLIRRTLPSSASVMIKKQLYISLVHSHFSYCSQICMETTSCEGYVTKYWKRALVAQISV